MTNTPRTDAARDYTSPEKLYRCSQELERESAMLRKGWKDATQDCIHMSNLETKARLERDALGAENESMMATIRHLESENGRLHTGAQELEQDLKSAKERYIFDFGWARGTEEGMWLDYATRVMCYLDRAYQMELERRE